jgi:hypothetical protein
MIIVVANILSNPLRVLAPAICAHVRSGGRLALSGILNGPRAGRRAFDNIMVFPDRFKNHILPEQIHILNVAFLVPEMRREFGGCAGNIAYNLMLLGGEPLIMATVGDDAATPYLLIA